MILDNVLYFPETNSVEVSWVDANGKQVRCHSYSCVQMDMLRTDLGADAGDYTEMIALVESNIQLPDPAVVAAELAVKNAAEKEAVLTEFRKLRDTALARLNGIQMDSTMQSDIDAIKVAKQGLKDLPSNPAVVSAVTGDQTEDALQAIYYGIAAQLAVSSPYAYTAFRNLDV